jgi:hypothetical protein
LKESGTPRIGKRNTRGMKEGGKRWGYGKSYRMRECEGRGKDLEYERKRRKSKESKKEGGKITNTKCKGKKDET